MGDTDAKSNGALRCARAPAAPALSAIPSLLPPSLAHSAHSAHLNALNASNASCSMLSLHQRLGPNIGPSMPSMPSTFQAFPSWAPGPPALATSAPLPLSQGSPVSLIPVPVAAVGPVAPVAPLTTVAHPLPAVGPSLILSAHSAHAAHSQISQSMPSSSPVASPMSPTVTSFGLSPPKTAPAPGFSAPHAQNETFLSVSRSPFTFGCTEEAGSVVDLRSERFAVNGSNLPLRVRTGRRAGPHSRRVRRVQRTVQSNRVHPVWPDAWNLIPNPSIRQSDVRLEAGNLVPPVKNTEKVLIWHCRHPHGLFSMFSLALGHAETCEKQGLGLIVDWTSSELLYRGPPGEPNVWTAFFVQPAEIKIASEAIRHAIRSGQYMETSKHHVVYGHYRGVIQDYGGIPAEQAARGRALCRRSIALQPRFQEKLEQTMSSILKPGKRLAVHIRRSDKVVEAAANFELSDDSLLKRIISQCVAWKMDGVFLCSDDASLKTRLTNSLERYGLLVSTYDATLPAEASQAVHFDKSLDSYKKAEDVVIETFLMAKGCHGLLSTYSNVSAAVVYLSPDSFQYTTFWDPVEVQEDVSPCTPEP